jgi:AcrR family transcriptional regulator
MNGGSVNEFRAPPQHRRERERKQRRDDILHAAEKVFAARGFHAASIEQIASTAEYATGTVYLYFKDKEGLFVELFEDKIRELGNLIRERTADIEDPEEALRQLVMARMDYFERNRAFFTIYAREGMNRYESRQDRWTGLVQLYEEYLTFLAGIIRGGQRRGVFRKGNPRQFAIALSGMMIQLTRDLLQSQENRCLTDLAPFVTDLFLKGAKGSSGGSANV